uniref:Bombyxin A-2 homolog n=1 Tax=Samia cynthia TaxID=7127 RepID=BXA2_SAMCY|nr:RecName: Full=Bombyxin A-2 homolog; Contains: RecName: Full=Bombyxin A-2 homolog B chain; Contains: RecName: Full=Bombyxin A-2 homolog A chain; Flags: Precursor [Samia cynthia]BAA03021.1 Samia bombyxin homolog A-2 [Samia ricini]
MRTQVLFLIVVLAVMASGDDTAHVYCGRRLATMLLYVCDNQYQVKRPPYISSENEGYGWKWLERQRARQLDEARGKRQGIVEECCNKPCTENELLGYCYK